VLNGPHYTISDKMGQIRGSNLFHSFGQFNLSQGESATFTGPNTIANILSRVTGGSPSSIDGTIRSQIPGAHLYLLNPNGVMFGPNASLDVQGSFHVSTADYLRLADGARFYARLSETSTLSVAPPAAFGFLSPTPAALTVQGSTLQVSGGNTLALVGGDLTLLGKGALPADGVPTLGAPGGQIHLASMAAAGEVPVRLQEFRGETGPHLGSVELSQGALLDASGNGGGTVRIRSGRLLVDRAAILANNQGQVDGTGIGVDLGITGDVMLTNGGVITTDSVGAGRARNLRLTAGSVSLDTNAVIGSRPSASGDGGQVLVQAGTVTMQGGSVSTATQTQSEGNAGSLVVQVGTLVLTDGAQISSSTSGSGQGGNLTVVAQGTISIAGQSSQGIRSGLFSNALAGTGQAGTLFVAAPHVEMAGGRIQAASIADSRGDAGIIRMEVGTLRLTGGAQISSLTQDSGQGGTIQIIATDTLTLAGTSADGSVPSGLVASTQGTGAGAGNAGRIEVYAPRVTLTAGARISNNTFGPGQAGMVQVTATDTLTLAGTSPTFTSGIAAFAQGTGAGNAGSVVIAAPRVAFIGGAQILGFTDGRGQGGTVRVTATDTLTLAGPGSGIFVPTQGTGVGAGNAGRIEMQAPGVALTEGAQIHSDTSGRGQGGMVQVTATDTLTLSGTSSGVFANTIGRGAGSGNAGSVVVQAPQVTLTGGAQIRSDTSGRGQGGMVQVTATDTLILAGTSSDGRDPSGIFADARGIGAGTGSAGSLVVQAPRVTLMEGAQIATGTFGPGQGGPVQITATETLTLSGTSLDGTLSSGIFADARGTGTGAGNAGSVAVQAPRITLMAGAQISSRTFGPGQGGPVRITATESLTLAGTSPNGTIPSGISANAEGKEAGAGSAGSLVVQAPQVVLMAGAQISSRTFGPGQGGPVQVSVAESLTLAGTSLDSRFSSGIFVDAQGTRAGAGSAGSLVVQAPRVVLTGGAQMSSGTVGPGEGGPVQVSATESLTVTGTSPDGHFLSGIFALAQGTEAGAGNAGSIEVQAPHITLMAGAQINSSTGGPGQGGAVRVTATDTLALAGPSPGQDVFHSTGIVAVTGGMGTGAGNAGSTDVQAPRVTLTEGAVIGSGTFGPGQGGAVRVIATDTLTLSGSSPSQEGTIPSAIFASALGTGVGAGNAGTVVVEAGSARIAAGAQINNSTSGAGHGGTVAVSTADALTITGRDSGLRTTAAGSGLGGDITVQANQVQLTEGATISAESAGVGNAGSITITLHDMFLSQHGTVATTASQADGGNIQLTAPRLIRLRDSQITAAVGGGPATVGGNITIDPQFVLLENSQIVANAFQGQGGNIRLQAQQAFLADPASHVSASSALGINGQVAIQAPVTNISGAVAPLPQAFAQTAELLQSRCAARLREGTVSRLVVGGRDGVPLEPGSLLMSPLQRVSQEGGGAMGERVRPLPEAQHGRAWYIQAQAPEELAVECAQWRGPSWPTGRPKRIR
jgi:filamentous hemagglutinin family protein